METYAGKRHPALFVINIMRGEVHAVGGIGKPLSAGPVTWASLAEGFGQYLVFCWVVIRDKEAIAKLSRAIAFKADLHLLHLRAAFHEHIGDVLGALRDCRAALSVDPDHQEMLELRSRVNSHYPFHP